MSEDTSDSCTFALQALVGLELSCDWSSVLSGLMRERGQVAEFNHPVDDILGVLEMWHSTSLITRLAASNELSKLVEASLRELAHERGMVESIERLASELKAAKTSRDVANAILRSRVVGDRIKAEGKAVASRLEEHLTRREEK